MKYTSKDTILSHYKLRCVYSTDQFICSIIQLYIQTCLPWPNHLFPELICIPLPCKQLLHAIVIWESQKFGMVFNRWGWAWSRQIIHAAVVIFINMAMLMGSREQHHMEKNVLLFWFKTTDLSLGTLHICTRSFQTWVNQLALDPLNPLGFGWWRLLGDVGEPFPVCHQQLE